MARRPERPSQFLGLSVPLEELYLFVMTDTRQGNRARGSAFAFGPLRPKHTSVPPRDSFHRIAGRAPPQDVPCRS